MFDLINPYTAKIAIAARDGDSIRSISKKIKESYGWTYKWVLDLEKTGVITRRGQEIRINKKNRFYKALIRCTTSLTNALNLRDAYLLPNLTGLDYIFTCTDAVFAWTKGGYNIGRSKKCYPIFIEVLEKDKPDWERYFSTLKIAYSFKREKKKGIYFIISLCGEMEREYCGDIPVLPLAKTVEWAKKYSFNFQPALEMLGSLYHLPVGEKYAELP
ncbi:hypothetical protein HYU13_03860 [Candidatus Woesearchaeota archaeon]|nr:hypothetical protein [Candidatus Woesearchaeota archaeon]